MNKFMNFAANVQTVFNNDVNDFMAFSELLTDVALGRQAVSKEEANRKIVEVFQSVLGITKDSRPSDIRRAIRRNQALVFDIIEETVQTLLVTGWGNDPFFQKYVDQRNLALGDKNEFYSEDDSILSVMKVSGNHHDIIRQRLGAGTVQSIPTYWCAVKVYAEFERVVTGAEEFAKFVTKMYEAYDRYVKNTLYDAMVGYAASLEGMFKKEGDVETDELNTLCDLVSTATGCPVVIMGTKTALSKVIALQNGQYISEAMKDEHYRTGTLGMWEGKELVEIPQVFEKGKVGQYKISNAYLWIMPVADLKFIKLVNEGDTQLRSIADKDTNMDMTYEQEIQTKLGVSVMLNSAFGVYDLEA
jgi:hypothetical protein